MQTIIKGIISIYINVVYLYGILAVSFLALFNIFFIFIMIKSKFNVTKHQRLLLVCEIIYGLVNPVIYIAVIPENYLDGYIMNTQQMVALLFVTLFCYWFTRLTINNLNRSKVYRSIHLCMCILAALTLSLYLGAYCIILVKFTMISSLFYLPYYIIPYIILFLRFKSLLNLSKNEDISKYLYYGKKASLISVILLLFLSSLIATYVLTNINGYSVQEIEKRIITNKNEIYLTAEKYKVDPKLIATLIYYNLSTHNSINNLLETTSLVINEKDARTYLSLANIFDFSIGICQVKPRTAITAQYIYFANKKNKDWEVYEPKDYRNVYLLNDSWRINCIIPYYDGYIKKNDLLKQLQEDKNNIAMAGYILHLYQRQWESKGYNIEQNIDILVSLYLLGFQKSIPKEKPIAIKNIDRIMKIYNSAFIRNLTTASTG